MDSFAHGSRTRHESCLKLKAAIRSVSTIRTKVHHEAVDPRQIIEYASALRTRIGLLTLTTEPQNRSRIRPGSVRTQANEPAE
jgi:hypothetical protein